MSVENGGVFRFGPFCLDTSEQRLLRDRETVPLAPKVLDTLTVLVKNNGHILGKDELMSAVWGETFVEEGSLTRNISILRKALQENGEEKYIETVPKRGYRFVARVRTAGAAEQDPTPADDGDSRGQLGPEHFGREQAGPNCVDSTATPASGAGVTSRQRRGFIVGLLLVTLLAAVGYVWKATPGRAGNQTLDGREPIGSLAVLPFKVLGSDEENEPLGLGMADAIILRLSGSRQCRVRPTSAISRYTAADSDALKAGRELGVDAVLDGTVQHVGERVRVTAMLWSLKDGRPIWAGKFDETFGDIFALQDSVSARVAERLKLSFEFEAPAKRSRPTANVEAYRYYTMGYYLWSKRTKPGLANAIQYFRKAVGEDPNYALAYASLTDAYLLDGYYGYGLLPLQEAYDRAREAAARAIQLDDTLPEANIAAGMVKEFEGDLKGAEESYRRAIQLDPSSATARLRHGHLLASTSRLDEAIAELRIAEESDPASPTICIALGSFLRLARRYDESIKYSKMALELDPQSNAARENLAWAHTWKEMYGEAGAEFNTLTRSANSCQYVDAGGAYLAARRGLVKEARQLLEQVKTQVENGTNSPDASLQIGMVLCELGEREEAFAWLRRAVQTGRVWPYQLEYSAELDSLKGDPRFVQMIDLARASRPPVVIPEQRVE